VLAEDAFKGKTQPLGRMPAGKIRGVALPFVPAVAELVEDVPRHQVHRFGGRRRLLQGRGQHDISNLDDPMRRLCAHKACPAPGHLGGGRQNGQVCGRSIRLLSRDRVAQFVLVPEGPVAQPGPQIVLLLKNLPERSGVPRGVQRLQGDAPSA
jgi:hypothetical protein